MQAFLKAPRSMSLIQLTLFTLSIGLVFVSISYIIFFNSYSLPKLTVPALRVTRSTTSLAHMYRDILDDNDGQSSLQGDAKVFHGDKEELMKTEFMERVNLYLSNLNVFREVLSKANPIKLLGFYQQIEEKYYSSPFIGGPHFQTSHMNLLNDKNYCDLADLYFLYSDVEHKDLIYFTDFASQGFVRKKILPKLGYDILPGLSMDLDDPESERVFMLDPSIQLFFLKESSFHYFHQANVNFLCFSQMYNHIPGHEALRSTNILMNFYQNYLEKTFSDDKNECIPDKIRLPVIYELDDPKQRKHFINEMKQFNDSAIQKRKYKIRDKYYWVNRWDPEDQQIQEYELNERVANNMITEFSFYHKKQSAMEYFKGKMVQKIVEKPLTIQKNRVHIRAFFLIASTNPLSVFYHGGFATLIPFLEHEEDTQYPTVYPSFEGFASNYDQITMEDLIDTLFDEGVVTEDQSAKLEDNIKRFLLLIVKSVQSELLVHSGAFELFGVDFMLDENLDLWLIQVKTSPSFYWLGKKTNVFYENMVKDMIEIQLVYQRARLKEARSLFQKIHEKLATVEKPDYEPYKKRFVELNRNNFDPSDFLSKGNKFELLYLEQNKQGLQIFGSEIPKECQDYIK